MTACDVVRRPYRGHEAATKDSMPKGVDGYVVPPWPWYEGGRMDQLIVQVERGGSRPCGGGEGESLVEVNTVLFQQFFSIKSTIFISLP